MPFDFAAVHTPFRMQPGLRRLAPGATQLTPNQPGDRALQEKLAVLRGQPGQALLSVPGFDPAPALQALCAHAAAEHPDAFSIGPGASFKAHHLGWSLHGDAPVGDGPAEIGACLRALTAPWRVPALLSLAFAEDFAVIDASSGRIPWLAVCLPSHWAPEDKVGRHFAEVHAPVADNGVLIAAGAHLLRLVSGVERWERFVWTIDRSPALRQHPAQADAPRWPNSGDADIDDLAAQTFFRTERQTFIPMPQHAQAIFTIRVETRPLAVALAAPADARRVHDALASMSSNVLAYRGLTEARERLLAWLAARAAE
jgi:dimethylamine monooxygenase subunit A